MRNDRSLSGIVNDLWGVPAPAAPVSQTAAPEVRETPAAIPPVEDLWKTADETVDWTEALVREQPADGLTAPEKWAFYHQHAAAVLEGDLSAYSLVLNTADPLADLKGFVHCIETEPVSADRMHVRFTPVAAPGLQRLVSAVALRAARDLFALLPLQQVDVEATDGESALLEVLFNRTDLQHVRFAFIDPVDFVTQCSGRFFLSDA